jgi:hypothetical protein
MKKTPQKNKFKRGDLVTWISHAGGHYTQKIGGVIAVIPPNALYPNNYIPYLYRKIRYRFEFISRRKEESYIIYVVNSNKLYRPRTKYLEFLKK